MQLDAIFKLKKCWNTFTENHPKFPAFLNAVNSKPLPVDSEIFVSFTYPDGSTIKTSVKVKEEDLQLLETLKSLTAK